MIIDLSESYIERCDKETEEVLANEDSQFLQQPITYFKQHKNEFIYLESNLFEEIGVDAVSFEVDDVFGSYDVMLGLKLQKKYEPKIKEYLQKNLQGDEAKFDLMFNQQEGLWDLNFTLNYAVGFNGDMPIAEAYSLIYHFLLKLKDEVQKK